MKSFVLGLVVAGMCLIGSSRAAADDFSVAWEDIGPSVSYTHSNYRCVAMSECPAGLFIVNATDLNVRGCTVSGTTCSGTCDVCVGGGSVSICKAQNGDTCVIGGAGTSKCGGKNKGNCTYVAASSTPNKCVCPLAGSTTTSDVCNIANCQ